MQELVEARIVLIALPDVEGALRVAAAAGSEEAVGTELALSTTKIERVLEAAAPKAATLSSTIPGSIGASPPGPRCSLFNVLARLRAGAEGVVAVHDKLAPDPRFDEADVRLAESLVSRAAIAVDLSERVGRDSLRRVVEARLERARLAPSCTTRRARRLRRSSSGWASSRRPSRRTRRGPPPPTCATSSSRRSRTSAASPSSSGRARSTTSGSYPRSSDSRQPSRRHRGRPSTSRQTSVRSASHPRPRRSSTGSCRRR